MKTKYLLGATIVSALYCMSANAQLLGGHATGALNGALSGGVGGMRDVDVMGHGGGHGSFGTDLDTDSLRHSTRDATSRVTDRTRSTVGAVHDRSESTLGAARERAANTSAAARGGVDSAASTTMQATQRSTSATSSLTSELTSKADAVQPPKAEVPSSESAPAQSASLDGALSKSVGTNVGSDNESMPLAAAADGFATGDASASKRGVAANGSAQGSANSSFKR